MTACIFLERAKRIRQVLADSQSVVWQFVFAQHIEHGQTCGARNGIAAEGTEKFHAVGEEVGDFRGGDDGGQREGIPDGFAEHDDVRDDVLSFESPEMGAETAEADLHFVGDADAAGGADVKRKPSVEIAWRKNNLSGDAGRSLGEECGDFAAFDLCFCDCVAERSAYFFPAWGLPR